MKISPFMLGREQPRGPASNAIDGRSIDAAGRPFTRADYLALKAATRRACESAGSLADIAQNTRVDPALLSRYGNPINDTFVPIDVAMDLDALSGADCLLKTWASLRGFDLVSRTVETISTTRLADHIPSVAKELSEVVVELAKARHDTVAAAGRIEKEVTEAVDALVNLQADCRRVRAGGAA